MRDFLLPNLWKIALALGLMAVVIVIWGTTSTPPPSTPVSIVEFATATPRPAATITPAPAATGQSSTSSPSPVLTPITEATPKTPTATPTPIPVYHTVQPGEVPSSIAATYGLTVEVLMDVNQITDPTRLQIGQQLLIPVTVTPTPVPPTPTPTPAVSPTPTPEPVYHTVQPGDTLIEIAAKYDTSVEGLKLANNIVNPQALQVGQELLIPAGSVDFDTPTAIHIIESGDTFNRLAFIYGSTIEDIVAANPELEPTALRIGQQVIVPITSPPLNPNANPQLPQIISPEPLTATLIILQQQMIEATNAQRQANGLSPLQSDDELARIALAHAQDMVKRGYLAHVTPEGVDLRTRFEQHAVEANWIGENIQRNTEPADRTVASAINWLMDSPEHRANILHERFSHLGVGVVEEPPGWYTFVQVFAQRESPAESEAGDSE